MRSRKKLTSFIALLALTMMLFTSCVRSGIGVVIEANDTGTVEVSVGINETYYKTMLAQMTEEGMEDVDLFAGKETSTLKDGEDTYICYVEHKEFENLEELKTILLDLEYDFSELKGADMDTESDDDLWLGEEDTSTEEPAEDLHIFKSVDVTHIASFFNDTYHFSVTTNPQTELYDETEELALGMIGMNTGDLFKLSVAVTMPGTLVSETAEISENTATFTVTDFTQESVLTVDSTVTDVAAIVIVGIALIVLIAVIVFVFGRKKSQ